MSTGTPHRGLRSRIERSSAVLLVLASRQPRLLVAAVPLLLLVAAAVAAGPLALIPGLLLLGMVSWLAYLSWPRLTPPQRTVRIASLAVVVALIAVRVSR